MGLYNWISQMPFVDNHQLNLDFILSKYKKLEDDEAEIAASKEAAAASATEAAESATEAAASATEAAASAAEAAGSAEDAVETADSISASMTQIAVNTSRIDNIIANAGDGTIPSELSDIRVGARAGVYATAGSAVRAEDLFNTYLNIKTDDIVFRTVTTVPRNDRVINHKLTDAGLSEVDYSYTLWKYKVCGGQWYKIVASTQGATPVYQFQVGSNVPASGSTPRVGRIVKGDTDFIVQAPTTATHLVMSQLAATDDYDAVLQVIPEEFNSVTRILDGRGPKLESGNFIESGNYSLKQANNARFRTADPLPASLIESVSINPPYRFWYYVYDKDMLYKDRANTWYTTKNFTSYDSGDLVSIVIQDSSQPTADISGDIANITLTVTKTVAGKNELKTATFNSAFVDNTEYGLTKVETFTAAIPDSSNETVNFLFYTDPHTMWDTYPDYNNKYLTPISRVAASAPLDFVLCGGDWLNKNDTRDRALFKDGYVKGATSKIFDNHYMLVGNHDYNHLGQAILTREVIGNIWYGWNNGKTYYTLKPNETCKFYMFDTGIEKQSLTAFNNSYLEQLAWFGSSLETDNNPNICIAAHILYVTWDSQVLSQLADYVLQIAEAYNKRTFITINGVDYDYRLATGKVRIAFFGHTHADHITTVHTIPCVVTSDVQAGGSPTFDLVNCNFDSGVATLTRIGYGTDRTVTMA